MKRLVVLLVALAAAGPAFADYLGDFVQGDTINFIYDTYKATDGSDLQKSAAGTPSCVKDGGTTEITAGVTDSGTTGFDSVTGLNKMTVVASSGNGFTPGSDYTCGVRSTTLNGVTVTYHPFTFSIENRYPLKGQILARGTLSAGSTTSVAQVGATLTFSNQYVAREIWDKTTNEKQCITTTTDNGSSDTVTFSPNVPTAWANGDTFWIVIGDAPCYPVTLPSVSGAGGVYIAGFVSAGTADVDSDIGRNFNTHFKNGGAISSFKLDDIPTSFASLPTTIWNYSIDGYASRCILAATLSYVGGTYAFVGTSPAGTTTFKDPSGINTRIVGTTSGTTRSGMSITCP